MKTNKQESRRKFIKTAGKAAVVAPAAGIILSAVSKPALAFHGSGGNGGFCVIGATCEVGTDLPY